MSYHRKQRAFLATASLAVLAMPAPSQAQTAVDPQPAGAQGESSTATQREKSGVGEIIVTAQRKAESLQTVPIAIVAVTGPQLGNAGIDVTGGLPQVAPGLNLTWTPNGALTYLRGVGSSNSTVGEEGSVATYIDGVYVASLTGAQMSLNNIERVEVLKGPQGTLFGRNATGGLIQVITREPTFEPTIEGSLGYGNYDTWSGNLYASAGLSDNVAINFAGGFSHQGTGWGKNISGIPGLNGSDVNFTRDWALRSKLLYRASDALRFILSGDYDKSDSDVVSRTIFPGAIAVGGYPFKGSIYDAQQNTVPRSKNRDWGASLKAVWDLGGPTLTSTTAYRDYFRDSMVDQDGGPVRFVDVLLTYKTKTFQQELLLVGHAGRFDYTAGLFYFYSNAHADARLGSDSVFSQNRQILSSQITHSFSAYAQGTYHLTNSTNLTAGVRFTRDERKIDGTLLTRWGYVGPILGDSTSAARAAGLVIANSASSPNIDSKAFNSPSWHLALDHHFSPSIMAYASYSRGFKSGIFSSLSPLDAPVDPEKLDAYEIGLKSDLLDRRLRANLSGFTYRYRNIQLLASQVGVTQLLNAARARIRGVEAELVAAPPLAVGKLELRVGLSYVDGIYTYFPSADLTQRNPSTPAPVGGVCVGGVAPQPTGGALTGTNTHCSGSATGNQIIRTPPLTMNLGANYSVPVGKAGDLGFNISFYHNSGYYFEADNRIKANGYDLLNAKISFTAPNSRWSISAFVDNLTAAKYLTGEAQGVGDLASWGAPRTYGVDAGFKF